MILKAKKKVIAKTKKKKIPKKKVKNPYISTTENVIFFLDSVLHNISKSLKIACLNKVLSLCPNHLYYFHSLFNYKGKNQELLNAKIWGRECLDLFDSLIIYKKFN